MCYLSADKQHCNSLGSLYLKNVYECSADSTPWKVASAAIGDLVAYGEGVVSAKLYVSDFQIKSYVLWKPFILSFPS